MVCGDIAKDNTSFATVSFPPFHHFFDHTCMFIHILLNLSRICGFENVFAFSRNAP